MKRFEDWTREEKIEAINKGGNKRRSLETTFDSYLEQHRKEFQEFEWNYIWGADNEYRIHWSLCDSFDDLKMEIVADIKRFIVENDIIDRFSKTF